MATTPKKRKQLTEQQEMRKDAGREMSVYKADEMIQKGRHQLSKQEQRAVLYAISKIKPSDTAFDEYIFELRDFYTICGIQNQSYTELKEILIGLKTKCWWIPMKNDPDTESAVCWFNTVRTNKKSGKVTIKFHEDMMPYLLELSGKDGFYTGYNLRWILPMDSQYGPRLYELLKSYQKNNMAWFFEIDRLKHLLGAENYKDFKDFRTRVLDPAVEDINTYSDLNVKYREERGTGRGRPVVRVSFYMFEKKPKALAAARMEGDKKLDGETDPMEAIKAMQEDEKEQEMKAFIQANLKDE